MKIVKVKVRSFRWFRYTRYILKYNITADVTLSLNNQVTKLKWFVDDSNNKQRC